MITEHRQSIDGQVDVRVNNGEPLRGWFSIGRPVTVEVAMGSKPDPHWELVDSNGHYHAYSSEQPAYPTLDTRTERIECDGSCGDEGECEGYSITKRVCRICQDEVTPGAIAGPHRFETPGLWEWSVTAQDYPPSGSIFGDAVSVCIDLDSERRWGVAMVVDLYVDNHGSRVELIGTGPLGKRPTQRRG